ncbi:DegT/DnrJ/EryC1/StrS family aminotransferase [candidate division KSB1 bacterium]|nr:DegT/DnrJ/EryC1/StrS family aminotransferase [candidate division KSB1 bacterium]
MKNLAINGGKPVRTEPFPSWPVWGELERKNILKALDSGNWGYPKWDFVTRFEEKFAAYQNADYGICFNSGTSALMGALWAVGIQPGDEVIVPAYTFIATASAVIQLGAHPVFADIEPHTLHLCARSVEEHFTPKTKAVIAVHIGGRPADLTRLRNVCNNRDAALIEDAAQAWGAEWKNERVGAVGDAGMFSFQSSKNITAGEGGIVLTNDEKIAGFLRNYCNCGRLEDKPRYEHYFIGGNYRLSELQGALLMAQFESYPKNLKTRQDNAELLDAELSKIDGIVPVNKDENVTSNAFHMYMLRYKKKYFDDLPKNKLLQTLEAEGIPVHPGYTLPLYKQPVFIERAFGAGGKQDTTARDYGNLHLPETEIACSEEAVWLTQNVLLGTAKDMKDIIQAFGKVKEYYKELLQ